MEPAHLTRGGDARVWEYSSPPSEAEIRQVTRLVIEATGEMPVNGASLKIEQAAIKICQAAGAESVSALSDWIAEQGAKVIKLNFIGGDFCSWYAARRRRPHQTGPPARASGFCPACGGAKVLPNLIDGKMVGMATCGDCNGTGKITRQAVAG